MCENHGHPGTAATAGEAFHTFVHQTPAHAEAWLESAHRLEHAAELEPRMFHLTYLAVSAALGLGDEIPLHVELAREAGASREEIASAVLIGLPAAGNRVIRCLPIALAAFDRAAEAPAPGLDLLDPVAMA